MKHPVAGSLPVRKIAARTGSQNQGKNDPVRHVEVNACLQEPIVFTLGIPTGYQKTTENLEV